MSEDSEGGVVVAAHCAAEPELRSRGEAVARVLIVETSSTDRYARARAFGPDDDTVVFRKSLAEPRAGRQRP